MHILRRVLTLAIILLPLVLGFFPTANAQSDWVKIYDKPVNHAVLYDIDSDGELEVVTDEAIIDGRAVIETLPSLVFKADYNHDGFPELVTYTPSTGRLVIEGAGISKVYTVAANITYYSVYNDGFVLGNYVFGSGKYLYIDWVNPAGIVPLVVGDKLYAVYVDPEKGLVMFDGKTYEYVFPAAPTTMVVGAGTAGDSVYVLLSSETGTLMIEYNPVQAELTMAIYDLRVSKGYFVDGVFVATGESAIYAISMNGFKVLGYASKFIYPADDMKSFVQVLPPYITIAEIRNGTMVVTDKFFYLEYVKAADYANGKAVAVFQDGVYLYSGVEYPKVDVSAPAVVMANESFTVNVTGKFDYVEVTIGTETYTANSSPAVFNITLPWPGEHTIVVKACASQTACLATEKKIIVTPRPLKLRLSYPEKVDPYSTFELSIEAYDGLTNEKVEDVRCIVEVAGTNEAKQVTPFTNVSLNAVPVGLDVPLTVKCWGDAYEQVMKSVSIPVSEPYMNVSLTYVGGGKFIVEAYNAITKEPFDGTIVVRVNGSRSVYSRRALIKVPPGEHIIEIELVKGNVVYLITRYVIKYYENVMEAPAGEPIIVGDRVVTQTVTKTVNHTVTVTTPKIVEIEKTNLSLVVGVLVLGVGVGIMAAIFLPRRGAR
jgi:hypothetical protein